MPALLYGVILFVIGLFLCLVGWTTDIASHLLPYERIVATWGYRILWWGSLLLWMGAALAALDIFILLPRKRQAPPADLEQVSVQSLTVVLTAYNDEASIGLAVQDFRRHRLVRRVIVVDNNSRDQTAEVAAKAGAMVACEETQGYGSCVYRALQEGLSYHDTELTLLCEGDMTFRAADIDKFMAYIPHSEIVNGTRIVEQLRARDTQLTTFMYYGNFFVGKLLEAKHIGRGTFTDVGTTYKLCRNSVLRGLVPELNPKVNLEFNAHFLDTALRFGVRVLECPITFHNRVGVSKGGNASNARALVVGIRMIRGLFWGWGKPAGR